MFEITGDIWEHSSNSIIVITTNGSTTPKGKGVIGRGVARQAHSRYPDIAEKLGRLIEKQGNHVFDLGCKIASFPVEETAWSLPDLRLIARSAEELRTLADFSCWQKIIVPRPGCGGGGLAWRDVKPLLEPWFDERFVIISQLS